MNKTIVILHPAYWEQAMGGAELQISYLVNSLKERGHEVHYVFEDLGTEIDNNSQIQLHPLKKATISSKRFGNRWIFYHKKINEILKRLNPDIIYTRLFSSWSGLATTFALENGAIHLWALASDADVTRLNKPISILKPFDIIERKWVKRAFMNANFILVQNRYQEEELWRRFKKRGVFLRQSGFPANENTQSSKKPRSLNILWIANLKPIKQPQIFINLLEYFEDVYDIHFIMIGRMQPVYRKLVDQATEKFKNFSYLQELSNEEVNDYLSTADILVNTSLYEGFSNTFIQAWMRRVVVISMNSNPDNILTEQNIGFVAPRIEDIVQVVKYLVNNPSERQEMGERALKYAIEFHSYDSNISRILSLIEA